MLQSMSNLSAIWFGWVSFLLGWRHGINVGLFDSTFDLKQPEVQIDTIFVSDERRKLNL